MKKINIIRLIAFVGFLATISLTSCDKVADLSIDPIDVTNDFTFSPEVGYPGQTVTIKGEGLDKVEKVSFGTAQAEFDKSASEIKAIVPVKATSGKIYLSFKDKVYSSSTNFSVSDTPVPEISGFSPLEASRGTEVVIEGTLLDKVNSIMIGESEAEIIAQTEESITIITPDDFSTDLIAFFYDYTTEYGMILETVGYSPYELGLLLPSIGSIELADDVNIASLNIGDELKIRGAAFDLIQKVYFGDVEAAAFELKEDAEGAYVSVKVPEGATSGKVRFVGEDGEFEAPTSFAVLLPAITSFTPQKGSPLPGGTRPFSIMGTNLDQVIEVYVGDDLAEVISQSATQLLLSIDGDSNGTIALHSANGIVKSAAPFAFAGDFWVNDWDGNLGSFDKISSNNVGGGVEVEIVEEAGNSYAKVVMTNLEHSQSFYLWGVNPGHDDWFGLYVSNPDGVFFQFDIRVEEVDNAILDENGNIKLKIFTMDAKGWGAEGEYSYGANGPTVDVKANGDWVTFKMHLKDFVASGNGGLYSVGQVDGTAGAFAHPNSLRIMTFIFGYTAEEGTKTNMTVGLDNVKFVIE